ncbi:MAG: M48 family metalloprotease [Candidatus Eisenbacteria bacterium]|nr:M48 family metalloprotease [Candidatus Eisenbacteria bacterium]
MWEQITSNRVKSAILVAVFVAFVAFLGWVFGRATGWGPAGPVLAAVIAGALAFASYYKSDRMVLALSHARPAPPEEFPFLHNTVEGLAIAAGLPKPAVYVIDDEAPNAFATGRNPEHAAIAVTTGLLDRLNRVELEGVIGHEMSHIADYDTLLMTLAAVMVGTVALLSDWMFRTFLWGGRRRRNVSGGGQAGAIILIVGLVMAILSPLIAQLIKLAISRRREYLADSNGARLTRYPPGLASALEKIALDKKPLGAANKATAHLFIVNPLKEHGGAMNSLFSTHPPVEKRIEILRSM